VLALPLLGHLPAIGVLPKLLMAGAGSATALLVGQRRYAAAGAVGALAFMDWQIGALAALGALAGALLSRDRWRAAARVAAGGALALLPLLAWLAAEGALHAAWQQTLATLLVRGQGPWWTQRTLPERLVQIAGTVSVACPGAGVWLIPAGALGLGLFVLQLLRRRRHPLAPTLACLALYHGGVVAFSLKDYQSFGDLFILLHSIAFFAGNLLATLARHAAICGRRWAPRLGPVAGAAATLALAGPLLPSTLRTALDLHPPTVGPGVTLSDQRRVAVQAAERLAEARIGVVGPAEVLIFIGRSSALPFVYWNSATYHHYRRDADEGYVHCLMRLARRAGVDYLLGDQTMIPNPTDDVIGSAGGGYALVLRPVRRTTD
jgi:hypothetical protein